MTFILNINSYRRPHFRKFALVIGVLFSTLACADSSVDRPLKDEPQVTLEMFQDVIGKGENSKEILDIEKASGIKPERLVFDEGATVFLVWKKLGVEVLFQNKKVRTVFLQGANRERQYTEFPAKLPLGLQFNDSRREVERKLGPPDEIAGGEVIEVWVTYTKPKIGITYKSENLSDMDTTIQSVTMQ